MSSFCRLPSPNQPPSEFHYYLDNRDALALLLAHRRLARSFRKCCRRSKLTAKNITRQHTEGQRLFLHHELVISRQHFMYEMAARALKRAV
jgi:hypothetical protein